MAKKHTFCSYCGSAYPEGAPWPRACVSCANITYVNPTPVAVAIVPVGSGVLCIRRTIEPAIGQVALPGGFLELSETWQEGLVRELREETGLKTDPGEVRLFRVYSAARDGLLLLFGLCRRFLPSEVPEFAANSEASEMMIVPGPVDLAFPLHTRALAEYFHSAS
jgi:ADP-ribose pyrophosphatase YjhB (NUDIX family)